MRAAGGLLGLGLLAGGALLSFPSPVLHAQMHPEVEAVGSIGVKLAVDPETLYFKITAIDPEGAAASSDLKVGQLLVTVNGWSTREHSAVEVFERLKGPIGTRVRVGVRARGATEQTIELIRLGPEGVRAPQTVPSGSSAGRAPVASKSSPVPLCDAVARARSKRGEGFLSLQGSLASESGSTRIYRSTLVFPDAEETLVQHGEDIRLRVKVASGLAGPDADARKEAQANRLSACAPDLWTSNIMDGTWLAGPQAVGGYGEPILSLSLEATSAGKTLWLDMTSGTTVRVYRALAPMGPEEPALKEALGRVMAASGNSFKAVQGAPRERSSGGARESYFEGRVAIPGTSECEILQTPPGPAYRCFVARGLIEADVAGVYGQWNRKLENALGTAYVAAELANEKGQFMHPRKVFGAPTDRRPQRLTVVALDNYPENKSGPNPFVVTLTVREERF